MAGKMVAEGTAVAALVAEELETGSVVSGLAVVVLRISALPAQI